jgi:N-acetylated-alpha-linked acidic dipeptidase
MDEISRDVIDPQTKVTVFERSRAFQAVNAPTPKDKKAALSKPRLSLEALGSGSDYSPFFQHLGIPSLNLGYGGEDGGGEYHSIYDSYDHYVRFKDPKFEYGIALAKTAGRATLRLANADVLPFNFQSFQTTVDEYLDEVMALLENMREETVIENAMIDNKNYIYASDPTIKFVAPEKKNPVPFLDFSSLQNAMLQLNLAVVRFSELSKANPKPNTNVNALNKILYQAEQKLMVEGGLPRRPWYRHSIYAPGYYTGYGVKTLPGVREAIEQRNWKEAQEQIEIVSKAIADYTQQVDAATKILMMR